MLISRLMNTDLLLSSNISSGIYSNKKFVSCELHQTFMPWNLNIRKRDLATNILLLPITILADGELRYLLKRKVQQLLSIATIEKPREVISIGCCMVALENENTTEKFIASREAFAHNSLENHQVKLFLTRIGDQSHMKTQLNPGLTIFTTGARIKDRFTAMAMHFDDTSDHGEGDLPKLFKFDYGKPPVYLNFRKLISRLCRVLNYSRFNWRIEVSPTSATPELWIPIKLNNRLSAADPFWVPLNGKVICFFEGLASRKSHGKIYSIAIEALEPDFKNKYHSAELCLDLGVHISYPCVFFYEDTLFMICETSRLNSSFIFRYDHIEKSWCFVSNLLPGRRLLDPTVLNLGDRFILIASEKYEEDSYGSAVVRFFESKDLFSDWHELSHLKIWDDRFTRSAGRKENKLVFQDYSMGIYGKNLRSLNVEDVLSGDLLCLKPEVLFSSDTRKYHHYDELGGMKIRDSSTI